MRFLVDFLKNEKAFAPCYVKSKVDPVKHSQTVHGILWSDVFKELDTNHKNVKP